MPSKNISIGAALKIGWQAFTGNITFWLGFLVILTAIFLVFGLVSVTFQDSLAINMLLNVAYYVAQIFISIGIVKIGLAFADNRKPSLTYLYDGYPLFWRYLGANILQSLIGLAGFILLIVPGIVWGLKFQFTPYLVVDKNMRPVEALKASANVTSGAKWELFGYALLSGVLSFLTVFTLFIGLIALIPVITVATSHLFRQLQKQTEVAPQPKPAAAPVQSAQ